MTTDVSTPAVEAPPIAAPAVEAVPAEVPAVEAVPAEVPAVEAPPLAAPAVEAVPAEAPPVPKPTVQVDALTVDLLAPCVRIHLTGGLTKLVSYLDFIELLRLNLDIKDGSKDAGQELFLPNGTFYLSKDDQTIRICTYHPECIQPVNYRGTVRQSTVPNIIISMVLSRYADGYRVTESRYFATKSPLGAIPRHFISRSSGFSILPFTNVYEDGRLCFGSSIKISSFQLPDLRGLHSFYQVLFDAPFNDDLGLSALKTRFRRATYDEWYAYLAKQAKDGKGFPYEELEINS